MDISKTIIGAGCFWGVQEFFRKIDGVKETTVGYSGGHSLNPSYEDVCRGNTGHIEVVLIKFDINFIKFSDILNYFWKCHDPTQLNRQGYDIGEQYKSIIFYFNEDQKNIAEESKINMQSKFIIISYFFH